MTAVLQSVHSIIGSVYVLPRNETEVKGLLASYLYHLLFSYRPGNQSRVQEFHSSLQYKHVQLAETVILTGVISAKVY